MSEQQLINEGLQAAKSAKHNLKWIRENPDRIIEGKQADMEEYLNTMIRFAKVEKKNSRLAGRPSLRSRLRELVMAILPQSGGRVKRNA